MQRFSLTVLAILACFFVTPNVAIAADVPASQCIQASALRGGTLDAKGLLTNTCDVPVGVVYGYDTKFDGTRKARPWCQYEGDYGNEHPAGSNTCHIPEGSRAVS